MQIHSYNTLEMRGQACVSVMHIEWRCTWTLQTVSTQWGTCLARGESRLQSFKAMIYWKEQTLNISTVWPPASSIPTPTSICVHFWNNTNIFDIWCDPKLINFSFVIIIIVLLTVVTIFDSRHSLSFLVWFLQIWLNISRALTPRPLRLLK